MIREMKDGDWGRVAEIYQQSIEAGDATFTTVCPTFAEWNAEHLQECRFVFEQNGTVEGWVALSPASSREAYRGVVEVSIYIDEHYRDRGIGTALLEKVCDAAEQSGFWCLYVSIFEKNRASILLHQKCGFREIGHREKIAKDRFGIWQNTVLMERRNGIE